MGMKETLYLAISEYLLETLDVDKAEEQANLIIENIISLIKEIEEIIDIGNDMDSTLLSQKYHTVKNLLLYGDFYYESDICQDIEETLRATHNIESIKPLHTSLIESLNV